MPIPSKLLPARAYRELVYDGMLPKLAVIMVCGRFRISRATLYRRLATLLQDGRKTHRIGPGAIRTRHGG